MTTLFHGKPKFLKGTEVTLLPDSTKGSTPYPPVFIVEDIGELWTQAQPKAFKGFVYKVRDIHDRVHTFKEDQLQGGVQYLPDENRNFTLQVPDVCEN